MTEQNEKYKTALKSKVKLLEEEEDIDENAVVEFNNEESATERSLTVQYKEDHIRYDTSLRI